MSDDRAVNRICEHCGAAMKHVQTVPKLGALPELRTYRCLRCDNVMTVVVDADKVA